MQKFTLLLFMMVYFDHFYGKFMQQKNPFFLPFLKLFKLPIFKDLYGNLRAFVMYHFFPQKLC